MGFLRKISQLLGTLSRQCIKQNGKDFPSWRRPSDRKQEPQNLDNILLNQREKQPKVGRSSPWMSARDKHEQICVVKVATPYVSPQFFIWVLQQVCVPARKVVEGSLHTDIRINRSKSTDKWSDGIDG